MDTQPSTGALFACKFKSEQLQFAFVTSKGVYRLAIDTLDNDHEMERVKQMRSDSLQIAHYLSGLPPFYWYSDELRHLPGVNEFLQNGIVMFAKLEAQQTINAGTTMTLEYIGEVPVTSIILTQAE
mgnify:CR=1 FL=1